MKNLLGVLSVLLWSTMIWAATCCGGAGALPSLITGDERVLLGTSWAQSALHTRVSSNGVWRRQNQRDDTQTLRLDYAQIFQDRFQYGVSLPLMMRTTELQKQESSSGMGDVNIQMGYEYLTDWDYSEWQPRGVGYVVSTLPTGLSKYETNVPAETRGKGFYSLGAGTVFTKQWSHWDSVLGIEIRHGFSRHFDSSIFSGEVQPAWGKAASIGAGYQIGNFRCGSMMSWNEEDQKQISSSTLPNEDIERYATGSVTIAYSTPDFWNYTVSYADQTILGNPSNTTLSKIWTLTLQKRWPR